MSLVPRGRKSKADKDAVLKDYKAGMQYKDLVKKHGCASGTIYNWVRDAGLVGTRDSGRGADAKRGPYVGKGTGPGHWVVVAGIKRFVPCDGKPCVLKKRKTA